MEITRYRGDTSADRILVSNDSTGEVVNLTGSTLVMTVSSIANPPDDSTELYQLTGVVDVPTSGVVEFSPSNLQADLVGVYYYDIQLTDGSGKIRTIAKGVYKYLQDITKD